jgi:hypothetical protein
VVRVLFAVSAIAAACGGSGGKLQPPDGAVPASDGAIVVADAAPAFCDTGTQWGCGAGEKCTWVPALGRPACTPDGSVGIGAACRATAISDNCARGGYCADGTCVQLCVSSPMDSCSQFTVCDVVNPPHPIPYCVPRCNPVLQLDPGYDECPAGSACYMDPFVGKALCVTADAAAADRGQDAVCYSSDPNVCPMTGCAPGYESFLPPTSLGFECGAFCTPSNSYKGSAGTPLGIAPDDCGAARIGTAGTECRFIQHWYPDSPIPSIYGVCLDTATWGDCVDFDPQGMVDAYNTVYAATPGDATTKADAAEAAFCAYCGLDSSCHGTLAARCNNAGCIDLATQASFDAMYGATGAMVARRIQAR